jgi:hypothetical protein
MLFNCIVPDQTAADRRPNWNHPLGQASRPSLNSKKQPLERQLKKLTRRLILKNRRQARHLSYAALPAW